MSSSFIIFPAIDLRSGQVVRLKEGNPDQQSTYSADPAQIAEKWLAAGASWLHVVNLDGALGESGIANRMALQNILVVAHSFGAKVQFGGGLRSLASIQEAFDLGIYRVILSTLVAEHPELLPELINRYGAERIGVSLDAKNGLVQIKGWKVPTQMRVSDAASELEKSGVRWLVFTDISRDGMKKGLNLPMTVELKKATHLEIIASGGVHNWQDIQEAFQAHLAGVIVGKALYEGTFIPEDLFRFPEAVGC
jgi:phosphoribosylformimino-5-aminoimidazole carboxamide ribotide isomerase